MLMLIACHTFLSCWPAMNFTMRTIIEWLSRTSSSSLLGLLCSGLSRRPDNLDLSCDSAYRRAVCRVAGPYEPGVSAQEEGLGVQILGRPSEVDVMEMLSRLLHLSCWRLCAWVYNSEQKGWRSGCLIALLAVVPEFTVRVGRRGAKAEQGLNEKKTWKLCFCLSCL